MRHIGHHDRGGADAHRQTQHDAGTPGKEAPSAKQREGTNGPYSSAAGYRSVFAAGAQGTGSELPAPLRERFERSLGTDLGAVRVHTGAASEESAEALGAQAYAQGTDIHFARGQYNPGTEHGDRLIAHEVAHTVQTAGAATAGPQCKLEVSQPGDAAEVEADHAADAMVAGHSAKVSSANGSTIHRQAASGAPVVLKGIDIPIVEVASPKVALGSFFTAKSKIGGKVSLKPGGEAETKDPNAKTDAKGNPVEVKVGADKDKLKLAAEKEFGEKTWGIQPKLFGEAELDKNGKPKLSIGVGLEHEGMKLKNKQFGPFALNGKAFEWEKGGEPVIAAMELEFNASATTEKPFYGHHVGVGFKGAVEVEPNWETIAQWIGKQIARTLASSAAGAAGAMAVPFAAFGGMLVAWAKAGHEFDEVQARIRNLHFRCKVAADEALTGKHVPVMMGGLDLNAGSTDLANQVREALSRELKIPPGAFPAAVKQMPSLVPKIYSTAWSKTWPGLKAKLLENYKDTMWTSYKFERLWLDSFDTGEYSKG